MHYINNIFLIHWYLVEKGCLVTNIFVFGGCLQFLTKLLTKGSMHFGIIDISFQQFSKRSIFHAHCFGYQNTYIYISIKDINLMSSFKLSQLKPNNQPKRDKNKGEYSVPSFSLLFTQINYQNYPIQALLNIIEQHFSEESPPANIICKALKVLSISLNDKQLRSGFQQIILKNRQKKRQIFLLLKYLISFSRKERMLQLINKFSEEVESVLVSVTVAVYLLGESDQNYTSHEIGQFIEEYISEITSNSQKKLSQLIINLKDEFLTIRCDIENLIKKSMCFNTKKLSQGSLKDYYIWIFQQQKTEGQLKKILKLYIQAIISDSQSHSSISSIDNFFSNYLFLNDCLSQNLKSILTPDIIFRIWHAIYCGNTAICKLKTLGILKSTIRQSINEDKEGQVFWRIFEAYYGNSKISIESITQKKEILLDLGAQLDREDLFPEFIIKKYLYSYFSGENFELEEENNFIAEITKKDHQLKNKLSHSVIDPLAEIIRALWNCGSKGGVNLICLNKIYSLKHWPKSNIVDQQFIHIIDSAKKKLPDFENYWKKMKTLYEKMQEKCTKKGQKIQLAYNVLIVSYSEKDYMCTLEQIVNTELPLQQYLSSNQPEPIYWKALPVTQKKSQGTEIKTTQERQYHSIVYQAKIIKLAKKSNKAISINQIKENIKIGEQRVSGIVQKLIQKGFLQEKQNHQLIYLA